MGIFGAKSPDTSGASERAAAAERERLARESAQTKAANQLKSTKAQADAESKRRAFAGQLATIDEEEQTKKRYLQAV
jgi:hypothetical protein